MRLEYISFQGRSARSEYVAERFAPYLTGKILDVGCDKAVLRKLLPNAEYLGVDCSGSPDISINLEAIDALPFHDAAFDCVLCVDVLEHLDNLHHMFGELIRVSKRYVIISLPNNWANARLAIARGKGAIGHYGLPADAPQDRHKWFFSLSDAKSFLDGQQLKYPISIMEWLACAKPKPGVVRAVRRLLYLSEERYLNRYAHTLWAVIEKNQPIRSSA